MLAACNGPGLAPGVGLRPHTWAAPAPPRLGGNRAARHVLTVTAVAKRPSLEALKRLQRKAAGRRGGGGAAGGPRSPAPLLAWLPWGSEAATVQQQEGQAQEPSFLSWLRLPTVLYPWDSRYKFWTTLATAAAAFSGFLLPWEVAFSEPQELYQSLNQVAAALDLLLVGLFGVDMILNFRMAYYEGETLVQDPRETAAHYMRTSFPADLLGFLPLDWLALAAAGGLAAADPVTLSWLPLLKLVDLVRLYRVRNLFQYLEYNLNVSLLNVTIARNLAIVLYICHWLACGFFYMGHQSHFDSEVLSGVDANFLSTLGHADAYLYCLYWSVTTLSMVEANTVATTMPETVSATIRASLFMAFNIALGSYILGTITLLVVKSDERSGKYRDQSNSLRQYTQANNIPMGLKESMQEHLRLHFDTQDASDEQILSIFPSTIRRRIMQYLYLGYLRKCYLFAGCPQRFIAATLATARIEVFMPGVDILTSGDMVNELFLLVNGTAEVISPNEASLSALALADGGSAGGWAGVGGDLECAPGDEQCIATFQEALELTLSPSSPITADLEGVRMPVPEGSLLGEAAFFTEVPQLEAVRSLTVCRVLVINRAAFQTLERAFPSASRVALQNLRAKAEQAVGKEFRGKLRSEELDALWTRLSSLQFGWASTELQDSLGSVAGGSIDSCDLEDVTRWSLRQQQVMSNLLRIRAMVQQYILRQDIDRTTEFLYAASAGNESKMRQMLQQGCPVDSADYDGRTALELACVKGHRGVVELLLAAGATPGLLDNLGSCALLEACKYGHDDLVDALTKHGATLGGSVVKDASTLCNAVFEGNLPYLRRLIKAGVGVDSGDYDKRTALHISAAEGNLQAVRLLVEEGGAEISLLDRWGNSALDEARRVGAGPVVRYMEGLIQGAHPSEAAAAALPSRSVVLPPPGSANGAVSAGGAATQPMRQPTR